MSILIFPINNFPMHRFIFMEIVFFFFFGVKTIVSQTSLHHIGLEPQVLIPYWGERSYLNGTSRLVILSECYNTNGERLSELEGLWKPANDSPITYE